MLRHRTIWLWHANTHINTHMHTRTHIHVHIHAHTHITHTHAHTLLRRATSCDPAPPSRRLHSASPTPARSVKGSYAASLSPLALRYICSSCACVFSNLSASATSARSVKGSYAASLSPLALRYMYSSCACVFSNLSASPTPARSVKGSYAASLSPLALRYIYSSCVGLARTTYIRCIYGIFGREIIKHTVIYSVYIRFWPTLLMCLCFFQPECVRHFCTRHGRLPHSLSLTSGFKLGIKLTCLCVET